MGYARVSVKDALLRTCVDVDRNHTLQMAAALSYYFVLSLFPALVFLSAAIAYLPIHDLSHQTLILLAPFLPAEGMDLIRRVLGDVIRSDKGTFLSFRLLGTLWTIFWLLAQITSIRSLRVDGAPRLSRSCRPLIQGRS